MGALQGVVGGVLAFVGGAKNKGLREGGGARSIGLDGGRWARHGPRSWPTRFRRWGADLGKGHKARGWDGGLSKVKREE